MTCDTNEDGDPYKISISQEDGDDEGYYNRKGFFERGLRALLADEHFLLLYVPSNGAKMQIIQPANDPCHRKRMIKKINEAEGVPSFYYALSHLWGLSEKNQYPWDEIGQHVNDEKGKPAESVQMRPEKRDTLLALLKSRPDSYWWIDVLCARTKTPLDIMGDIYSYCFECVAMIDCDPSVIPQLRTMTELRQEIPCLQGESFKSSDFNERLVTKCLQLAEVAKRLMESEWWKRVWTWQEMALPFGDVRFIAETAPHPFQHNTITLNELLYFQKILAVLLKLEPTEKTAFGGRRLLVRQMIHLKDILGAKLSNKHRIGKKSASEFFSLIDSWGFSTRRCMDPVDYVYGVLGMLQLKISRDLDPDAVWKHFLYELGNYIEDMKDEEFQFIASRVKIIGINDRAYNVNLQKAKYMHDVYKDLLALQTLT